MFTIANSFRNGTVSATSVAGMLVSCPGRRKSVTLTNLSSGTVYLGSGSTVATTNGFPVGQSSSITLNNMADIWGIVASGANDLRYLEEYDV